MKKCITCDDEAESVLYKYCYDCWWIRDPRNLKTQNKELDMVWSVLCRIEAGPKVEGQRVKLDKLRKHLKSFTEAYQKRKVIK